MSYARASVSRTPILTQKCLAFSEANAEMLARTWFPDGKPTGRGDWSARNWVRGDKSIGSFLIRVSGDRVGMWRDFATHHHGANLIWLFGYMRKIPKTPESWYPTVKEFALTYGIV